MDSRAFLTAKACLALGQPSSQSKHSELVGAKVPQPVLTPLHCILCTWNGFQFFRHPVFPACISSVSFQRGMVAIDVCRAVGKKHPLLPPTLHSHPKPGPEPCPAAAGPPCLPQVTVEGYSPASLWLHPPLGPLGWTRKELFVLQTSLSLARDVIYLGQHPLTCLAPQAAPGHPSGATKIPGDAGAASPQL